MLRPTRLLAALIGVLAIVLAAAIPASAHVTVSDPAQVTAGTFKRITFSVPNERTAAKTKKLKIVLPVDESQKLARALAKRLPGWSMSIRKQSGSTEIGEGVLSVTWTASSSASSIAAGQFEEFTLTVGPIPNTDRIYFDAVQYYDNGEVVRWDQRPTAETPHPEHPAPSVKVVPASTASDAKAASTTSTVALAGADAATGDGRGSSDTALLIGAVAAVGAGGLLWQRRRVRHADRVS
ncbi:YcnI family protein [Streptomyces sp. NPDC058794]|uniref:YcnI family copper-binding membrane protein n=1 Tax=unclassified Streptomyces TaxID=2593676 RepID=UPI00368033E1